MDQAAENIKADLHTHSYYSDGRYSPAELVKRASRAGISVLSVTDHDNVDGIDEAAESGKMNGVEIIPGVELSATFNGREVHVLGYFINYQDKQLQQYMKRFREERYVRANKIVTKLNELDIPLTIDDVMEQVKGNSSIGRPHIALALLKARLVENYYEAFSRYIGDGKPAHVRKNNIPAEEALKLINEWGGLSFVAHPGKNISYENLHGLIELGIDGIEVVHPSHSGTDISYLREITGRYFLLESGGSDFHGGALNEDSYLGNFCVPVSKVNAMKNRLFIS